MNTRKMVWVIGASLYLVFFLWYTNLKGPLTEEEIAQAKDLMQSNGAEPAQIEKMLAFFEADDGDDFIIVNIIDMKDSPDRVGDVAEGESSEQTLNRYMEHMFPELFSRASHPVFYGQALAPALDLAGIEGAEVWESAALMRYRSRRDILEIALNPVFKEKHHYKIAAIEKTIAYPVVNYPSFNDPRVFLFALILIVLMGNEVRILRNAARTEIKT